MEAFTRAIATATATGDLQVARVAYWALGQLLEAPSGERSLVTDLSDQRAKKRSG